MSTNTNIPGITGKNFTDPDEPKQRIIWSAYGETKTGKSSFGMWGPGPVVVFDLDRRLERVANDFVSGVATGTPKQIVLNKVALPKVDPASRKRDELVLKEADRIWDQFVRDYAMALESSVKKGGVRTIVVDTGTELFDLRLMAEFGRLMGINPRDRGGANAEFVEVMRRGEQYDANVVWLHHAKEEWKNTVDANGQEKGSPTGRYILDGFKKANSIVQVVVQTSFNESIKDPRKKFEVTVVRCGINSQINGLKVTSADWAVWDDEDKEAPPIINYGPLAYISALAVPDTTPEDWM